MFFYLQVQAIVKEIEEAFIRGNPLVAWMDDKTREIAIEKVRKIVQMIGYPDWILDTIQLDKYYFIKWNWFNLLMAVYLF